MDTGYSLSDITAATRGSDGMFGGEMGFFWIFALLLLPGLFGGGMWGNRNGQGDAVTEAGLCNAMNFNNLENSVGRLGDTVSGGFTGVMRDMCTGFSAINSAISAAAAQSAQCCCETNRNIDAVRYEAAQNTAAINATTTAQTQKILDAICSNRMADMQSRINQLELSQAMCGVVRYPSASTYNAGTSIWATGCGCGCGSV